MVHSMGEVRGMPVAEAVGALAAYRREGYAIVAVGTSD